MTDNSINQIIASLTKSYEEYLAEEREAKAKLQIATAKVQVAKNSLDQVSSQIKTNHSDKITIKQPRAVVELGKKLSMGEIRPIINELLKDKPMTKKEIQREMKSRGYDFEEHYISSVLSQYNDFIRDENIGKWKLKDSQSESFE